jgi:hypothetical protein
VVCRTDPPFGDAGPGGAGAARREATYLTQRFLDHAPLTVDHDFSV